MKKILILTTVLCAGLGAAAQLSQVTTRWARLLDAAPPDMGIDFALTGDAIYYLSSAGSTIGSGASGFPKEYADPTMSIYYDGALVATGAPYEGASYNNNLNLLKTDLDGRAQWCVYSTRGEVAANNGGVVSTPDGGVLVSAVVRHTDNLRTEPLRLTDATGSETVIDWTLPDSDTPRWFQGLLLKVSAAGAIEWARLIEVSNAPAPAAAAGESTGSAFYITGMAGDASGNCYVAGRYVMPITIDGTTLTPHNTEGWDGDSQVSRGDVFVAKIDVQGHLLRTLTTTGKAQAEGNASITQARGDLFVTFTATGTADGQSGLALDGHDIALPDGQQGVVLARLDSDLNVQWLQQWHGAQVQNRNAVMQNARLTPAGDHVWFTGQCNGAYTDGTGSVATTTGNIREGIVVKCDAATGQWLAATTSKAAFPTMGNGIQGYIGGFADADGENFYAYGYTFGGECVTLLSFDAATLAGQEVVTLIAGGSQPTAQRCIAHGNTLYTLSRGRDSHIPLYQLQPIGSDLSLPTQEWAVCMAAFALPFDVMEDATAATGDINADGVVDIDDMNIVINMALGKTPGTATADLNADGIVDVEDINALINIILHKT